MSVKVLDLFCGCGGISWGLYKAGFEIVAGIDNNQIALRTYQYNHPQTIVSCADISQLNPKNWFNEIKIDPNTIDCIVGGPPCQGFSKNVPRSQRFLEDNRNFLIKKFLEFVNFIRPPIVIMENVAEIVNAFDGTFTEEILFLLSKWGYFADVKILDAADYGIPQHRRRAFFFACQNFLPKFPQQTHFERADILPLFDDDKKEYLSVWDAIGDLPSLRHGEGIEPTNYELDPFSDYQILMRGNTHTLYNHVARKLNPKQLERLASIDPGQGAKELPGHLRPKTYYSGAYGRLTKEMVARTLTRWMFHPGSGRFGHPVDIRTLTIREGARLQSFSDEFIFKGSFTQASSQIGNSVPPLLIQKFAPIICQYLGITQEALTLDFHQ